MASNDEFFAQVLTSDGFKERFSRSLRPPSRAEKIAEFKASQGEESETEKARLLGQLAGVPTAETEPVQGKGKPRLHEWLASLSEGQRAHISSTLADVEYAAAVAADELEYDDGADGDVDSWPAEDGYDDGEES
jgi:hypothetical protein